MRRPARPSPARALAASLALPACLLLGLAPLGSASATPSSSSLSTPTAPASALTPASAPAILGTASEEDDEGLAVAITQMSPRILTSEDAVTIEGTVTNTTGEEVADITLFVSVQGHTPVSTEELTRFLSGSSWSGWQVARVDLDAPLAAGEKRAFRLTIPREDLPLESTSEWGPRGVTVTAAGIGAQGRDRSLLVWNPGVEVTPDTMSVLVPWTSANTPTSAQARESLLRLAGMDGVTIAVDEETLAQAAQSPTTPMRSLLRTFFTTADEVVALPDEDADPGLLATGGASDLLEDALATRADLPTSLAEIEAQVAADAPDGADAAASDSTGTGSSTTTDGEQATGSSPATGSTAPSENATGASDAATTTTEASTGPTLIDSIVWPQATTFTRQLLASVPSQSTVVAPDGALAASEDLSFTPISHVAVDTASGEATPTPSEGTVNVLTTLSPLDELLTWHTTDAAAELDTEQMILAFTSITSRERPNAARSYFVALPRGTEFSSTLTRRLSLLLGEQWTAPESLSTLLDSEVTDTTRAPVLDGALSEADASALDLTSRALTDLTPLALASSDPEQMRATVEEDSWAALSASIPETSRTARALTVHDTVASWLRSVHAEPSVTVNLINKTANFPVRVTNSLPWDVTVVVTLDPSDPRLRVTSPTTVTIPAESSASVEVPVTAIGSGDIKVLNRVSTPDGRVLDESQTVRVRMRAGWEDAGTMVFGGLVALAFVGGLVRTLRRRLRAGEGVPPGVGGDVPGGATLVSAEDGPGAPHSDFDPADAPTAVDDTAPSDRGEG